jgi:hypothetical protein
MITSDHTQERGNAQDVRDLIVIRKTRIDDLPEQEKHHRKQQRNHRR